MTRKLRLVPLKTHSLRERRKFMDFVQKNYASPIKLEDSTLLSDKARFFWAYAEGSDSAELIGVTGYVAKTKLLAETIKTVVSRDLQGQGWGAELSLAIEKEVRRRGFRKIMTTIYTTNLPMIFIKLKQGYRFEGYHPSHEKPGLDEYSFGKLIQR